MEELQCPKCQGPMKIIPAGISKKTGKPYDAFASCKNYGCGGTIKLGGKMQPGANFSPTSDSSVVLNSGKANELRIVKQAILKSSIEGGVIKKLEGESDEEFLNRWIKWVYKNMEQDKKLTETEYPF